MAEHTIDVPTPTKRYQCHVGTGILSDVGAYAREAAGGTAACIVSDSHVAPLYADAVASSLEKAGYRTVRSVFSAGEEHKRLSTLEKILEDMADGSLTRDDIVVAVGGGVTGDMGGLAAALYQRGIEVVQVPTSLLAMVDSSVGGKTAVDLPEGKNLVGAFWQPASVVADVSCFKTISPDLFRDSCGEVIKHAVLADPDLFSRLEKKPLTTPGLTDAELSDIVARNIEIKRDVVATDEKEHGRRQVLNLGHTIGHAVEAASDFKLGHGSCVAIGLCCMAWAAAKKGWCTEATAERIEALVRAHGLATDTALPHETILSFAAHDKKRHASSVNIAVPEAIGTVSLKRISLDELKELIDLGCGRSR